MTYASMTPRLSNRQKRASVLFFALLALAFANETFDWRLVGNYDWEAILALTIFGLGGVTCSQTAATNLTRDPTPEDGQMRTLHQTEPLVGCAPSRFRPLLDRARIKPPSSMMTPGSMTTGKRS